MPASLLDSRTTHVVLRGPLSADGIDRERGEVIDTSGWRNCQPLVNTRRIEPLPYGAPEPITCECGRLWVDAPAASTHRCPARKTSGAKPKPQEKN